MIASRLDNNSRLKSEVKSSSIHVEAREHIATPIIIIPVKFYSAGVTGTMLVVVYIYTSRTSRSTIVNCSRLFHVSR